MNKLINFIAKYMFNTTIFFSSIIAIVAIIAGVFWFCEGRTGAFVACILITFVFGMIAYSEYDEIKNKKK
jgi:hypothetical protein